MKKEETLFFTGHRDADICPGTVEYELLERTIIKYAMAGCRYFIAGGALGFDTVCARCVLSLKDRGLDVALVLMLPCRDQDAKWSAYDRHEYREIMSLADSVIYTSEEYTKGCMLARDRAMADVSSVCIAYCTRDSGGTAYTVRYASSKGIPVVNLALMNPDT